MAELKHKNKYYTAKRFRVYEYLLLKGFKPEKTIPDPKNPKFDWWLFPNSAELEEAVTEYFKK